MQDRGAGIAPEDQARIFGRFQQVAGRRLGGFGLGLWIARQIDDVDGISIVTSTAS